MRSIIKEIGYFVFSIFYHIFLLCKMKQNKVCCIMHHDSSEDGNIGIVVKELKKVSENYEFVYITKEEANAINGMGVIKNFIPFFIKKSYHLATSEYILQDDVFLPMSYLKLRKEVKDIQLWHGTGTIKKFGQDFNTGRLKTLEKRANRNITHLIVNSSKMIKQYSGAFGIDESKVFAYGLPRTDTLLDKDKLEEARQDFYKEYPELKETTLVLYAPTFRDEETKYPIMKLELNYLLSHAGAGEAVGVKWHPFVAKPFAITKSQKENFKGKIYDFTNYKNINSLLAVTDLLVTDYSSIIFEFCVQIKPMIFFAYDLEEFSDSGRGFYKPYEEYIPGQVVKSTTELVKALYAENYDYKKIEEFKKEHYEYLDGKSTERIIQNIFRLH